MNDYLLEFVLWIYEKGLAGNDSSSGYGHTTLSVYVLY